MKSRSGVSDGEAVSLAVPDKPRAEPEPPDARPVPWVVRSRGRAVVAALGVVLAVAGAYAVSTLGPVRTVLRQSFTRIESPSVQFYLNGNPWISGQFLNVPLGIILQNGPSATSYEIRVWTVDGAGTTDASTMVALPVRDGKGAVNYSLTVPVAAQLVWAQVQGTSLSVHYRFAGSAAATAGGSH